MPTKNNNTFGYTSAEWQNMTEDQQKRAIDYTNEMEKVDKYTKDLESLVKKYNNSKNKPHPIDIDNENYVRMTKAGQKARQQNKAQKQAREQDEKITIKRTDLEKIVYGKKLDKIVYDNNILEHKQKLEVIKENLKELNNHQKLGSYGKKILDSVIFAIKKIENAEPKPKNNTIEASSLKEFNTQAPGQTSTAIEKNLDLLPSKDMPEPDYYKKLIEEATKPLSAEIKQSPPKYNKLKEDPKAVENFRKYQEKKLEQGKKKGQTLSNSASFVQHTNNKPQRSTSASFRQTVRRSETPNQPLRPPQRPRAATYTLNSSEEKQWYKRVKEEEQKTAERQWGLDGNR